MNFTVTTITGSDRLARHLHGRFVRERLAAGDAVWERPDILPVAAFWRRLFDTLADRLPEIGRPLDAVAESAVWESLIAADAGDSGLLQLPATARAAQDAYRLATEWQLDAALLAAQADGEARRFLAWAERFERRCRDAGWVPQAHLPLLIATHLDQLHAVLPARLEIAGLDEAAPGVQAVLQAIAAAGVEVVDVATPSFDAPDVARVACADPRLEALAAAQWTAERLRENPAASVGIVVLDLEARRDAVMRALRDVLAPGWFAAPERTPPPFNISLGVPLRDHAPVHAALDALSLAGRRTDFITAGRLLRSAHFAPASEAPARAALDLVIRDRGLHDFSPGALVRLARERCPQFAQALADFLAAAQSAPSRLAPSAWARRFTEWLHMLRWLQDATLDSDTFQLREAWHQLLARFGELDAVLPAVTRDDALARLRRLAAETLFQPRAAAVPVQVLGLFEAIGQSFDALWVMGASDEQLPAAPRPNPFLPLHVQRRFGLPQSGAARERAFAARRVQALAAAAPLVRFSHATQVEDRQLRASPLILPFREYEPPAVTLFAQPRAPLESWQDRHGPALATMEISGGTSLVKDQAACPFRAFAVHRLRALPVAAPRPGPDARLRGKLVHAVLHRLWLLWRDRRTALADAAREETVRTIVSDEIAQAARSNPEDFSTAFCRLETARLTQRVLEWLAVDLARDDFTVEHTEQRVSLQAGPLRLHGQRDRVDRLEDGSRLVIDYKTARQLRPAQWFGARPDEPQLPLYSLTADDTPTALAFARVRAGECGFIGVSAADTGIPGIDAVAAAKDADGGDWTAQRAAWKQNLDALGAAFAAGEAAVDPKSPQTCRHCHLQVLCRVHERHVAVDDDGDAA